MKLLPVLIGLKLGLLVAGAGVWAALETGLDKKLLASRGLESLPKPKEDASGPQSSGSRSGEAAPVPEIPPLGSSLSAYQDVRTELETMRQDVEEKLVRLRVATQGLEAVRAEANEKLALTRQEKQLLDETLQKEKTVKQERIEQALAFIEKMEPRKAAPLLESMDRDLVIELFKRLKPKTVTKFLESMSPRKATEHMEYYTRIRSGREYELLRDLRLCSTSDIPEEQEKNTAPPAEKETAETPAEPQTPPEAAAAPAADQ